jgi:hypothetical protein
MLKACRLGDWFFDKIDMITLENWRCSHQVCSNADIERTDSNQLTAEHERKISDHCVRTKGVIE